MSDPRIPEAKQGEAQLPDDLDQNPDVAQSQALAGHGSEDAQLLAGEKLAEAEVETEAQAEPDAGPDDLGRTGE